MNAKEVFVVFLPVYKPGRPQNSLEERRLNLQGYVSGAFRIRDMMNNALKDAKTDDIEIRLFDVEGGGKKRLLYEHRSKEHELKDPSVAAHEGIQPAALQRAVPFEIAGHQWIVQFAPAKAYLIAQRGWQAWSVLAGGLFFTGLLGGFLLVLTGHTAKLRVINTDLEKEITERKRAESTVTQLAAIVESSDDAIIGTTLEGVITSWNKGAEIIYGYFAEEVTGRPITILYPPDRLDEMQRLRGTAWTAVIGSSTRPIVGNVASNWARSIRKSLRRPEQQVRVEQEPHRFRPSKARTAESGSGALKSSGIRNLPSSSPSLRRPRALVSGTSLAAGLPVRAMMISSPDSARSTSFDNSVFA